MNLQELFRIPDIKGKDVAINIGIRTPLTYTFPINPSEFLLFAKEDFKSGGVRGSVNALTNAKRVIDCQTDILLTCLGYDPAKTLPNVALDFIKDYQTRYGSFEATQKLKLLQALDVVPSGMVSRIRKLRNALEHEYRIPKESEVQDSIELATLFRGATDNVIRNFLHEYRIGNPLDMGSRSEYRTCLDIWCDTDKHAFRVIGYMKGELYEGLDMSRDDKFYLPLLKLTIALGTTGDVVTAFRELLVAVNHPISVNEISAINVGVLL